jgi:ribonuclease P protein subunit RPR2
MKDRRHKPEWQTDIAKERIIILFREAAKSARANDFKRADRYVFLARKIGMKYNVKLTRYKRKFCKYCYKYLLPGANAVVRTNPRTQSVEIKCLECKKINRYPYAKEKMK